MPVVEVTQLLLLDLATLQVQKFSISKPEAVFCLLNLLQEMCGVEHEYVLIFATTWGKIKLIEGEFNTEKPLEDKSQYNIIFFPKENYPICRIKFRNILQKLKKKYWELLELIKGAQIYFFPLLLETQYKK